MTFALAVAALLVAGTKFRIRDADASLAGVLDAQILLELGLYAAIAVLIAALWIGGRGERRRPTRIEALSLGYAAIAILSSAWSLAPALTLVRGAQLAIVVVLAITATRVLTPWEAMQRVFAAVGTFVLICAALAATLPFASGSFVYPDGGTTRFAWFAVHPIEAGTLAAIGALGVLSMIIFKPAPQTPRPLGLPLPLAAGALIIVLIATASRGPLLAFLGGSAILILMRVDLRLRAALALTGVAALLAIVAAGPAVADAIASVADSDTAVSRVVFRGQTADEVIALNGRLDLWDDLRPAIADRPLFGYGYQASRSVLLDTAAWAAYAHNALLQGLLDLGVIGTLVLLSIVAVGLWAAISVPSPSLRGAIAGLMALLVLTSISSESFAGAPGIELLLLMLCALAAGRRDSVVPDVDWP